jgi:hypothetical protein
MIGIFINLWNRLTGGGTPAPTPALLDTYGGAAAAFSLRKLSSTYGGSAVRVRRSLDNTEQDIGFSGDNLDETALQAFVGYENLFTYSQQFENAAWSKNQSTITANAGTDPLGGNNAERWLSDVGSTLHYIVHNVSLVVGQSYTVSFWVKSNTGTAQDFRLLGSGQPSQDFIATTSWQRFTFSFVATSSLGHGLARPSDNSANDLLIFGAQLNQGVTAQPYQVTTTTANTANGFVTKWYTQDGNGENLLLQSQTFENAYWQVKNQISVSANAVVAPDGTTTGDNIIETLANDYHAIAPNTFSISPNTTYTVSVYAKSSNRALVIQVNTNSNPSTPIGVPIGTYDLVNGIFVGASINPLFPQVTLIGGGIQNAGNGWYRCFITFQTSSSANIIHPYFLLANSLTTNYNTTPIYTGNGTSFISLWGAQLSQSSWLQGYQATTTTAVSRRDASQATAASQPRIVNAGVIERENGKPAIFFDGVNDFLNTSNISDWKYLNFSGPHSFHGVFRAGYVRDPETTYLIWGTTLTVGSGFTGAYMSNSTASPRDGQLVHVIGPGINTLNEGAIGATPANMVNLVTMYGDPNNATPANRSYLGTDGGTLVNANTQTQPSTDVNPKHSLRIGTAEDASNNNILFFLGTMQELDFYSPVASMSTLQSRRSPIESNINNYYRIYWQGTQQALLDQFGGSAAAFSLRNLSSSYRGPLVRVRRSSDNAETDIGGTFSGDLDVNSLLAFTGGQNLLLQSEDIGNASWLKQFVSVTQDATIAPNGTLTADKITEALQTNYHAVNQFITIASVTPFTFSVYLKAAERNIVGVNIYFNGSPFDSFLTTVDLSTGAYVSSATFSAFVITSSVQNAGNGWWRISSSGVINRTGQLAIQLNLGTGTVNVPIYLYLGVSGSGVYAWGAQLNTGSVLQPYIPTTTAAINGANAFVTKWYDQSGIGDNRLLQSQTFEVAPWVASQSAVVSNSILAPDGTLTADKLNENTANTQHFISQAVSVTTRFNTFSVYLKAVERNLVQINLYNSTSPFPQIAVIVDLSSGLTRKIDSGGGVTTSFGAQNVGDGWYRVWASGDTVAPAGGGVDIIIRTGTLDSPINSYVGTTGWGVYMWGAQVSDGLELLRYQPTTTAIAPKRDAVQTTAASQPRIVNAGSVESENGKPAVFYNGTSNSLRISSIPLQTNITLITAIKNMSAVNPFIVEHSASASVNDGFFFYGAAGSMWNFRRTADHRAQGIAAWSGLDYSIYDLSYDTVGSVNTNGILASNGTITGSALPNTVVTTEFNIGSRAGSSLFSNMDMSEFVIYASPLGASLPSARSNLNTYYQIYWQGNGTALLDSFSGASAAYSLRNLSSAYTGPLIRVRRSSDNAERDIYGTFRGDLDLAALTSFVGANSGFVTTWYDQSGTGRHATQATAASQPRIVNAGAVETEGGRPSINFAGTAAILIASGGFVGGSFTSFAVYRHVSTTNQNAYTLFTVSGTYIQILDYASNSNYIRPSNGIATQYSTGSGIVTRQLRFISYQDSFLFSDYRNGSLGYSNNFGIPMTSSVSLQIGKYSGAIGQDAIFQELVFFATDRSSIRTAAESNINNYYKIY